MRKNKVQYNIYKALMLYRHPFEDRYHLERRKIRHPEKIDNEGVMWEVWSECWKCWLPVNEKRIYRIYQIVKNVI